MKNKNIIKLAFAVLLIFTLAFCFASCETKVPENDKVEGGDSGNTEDVVPVKLEIFHEATKTEYEVGDEFKLTGLLFQIVYSDGSTQIIASTKCERDVTGPLTADITKVTFTYQGLSYELPIKVVVKCTEHTFELVSLARKTNYVVGDKFYSPYKNYNNYPVKAVCSQCGQEGEISACTVSDAKMTIDTTSVDVTAVVDGKNIVGQIPVKVFESKIRLEAEAYFADALAEMKDGVVNYDKTKNYALYDDSILVDNSGLVTKKMNTSVELGTRKSSGHFIEFHFFAEEAGTYELVFSGLSTNVDAYVDGGATRVADTIVNNILTFTVNGRKVNLSDDTIIRGVGADDGVKKSILGQFTYISLGKVELFKGENIIKITQKNFADYCDLASDHSGNRYASTKVDAIEIFKVK